MNMNQEIEKQKQHSQLLNALDGISDEIHSARKENGDLILHLNNMSESLSYIATYLGDIHRVLAVKCLNEPNKNKE
tara:strand:- start:269 stop:496 length:228 start_codon:yes stop_codon:yes gene_type:complete